MTNDEKMKIFERQVLNVCEELQKFFEATSEKLAPVIDAIAKAAAVCKANEIDVTKETDPQKTCLQCDYYYGRKADGTHLCGKLPFGPDEIKCLDACHWFTPAQDASEAAETHDFKEGELIVYVKGTTAQIGEIKRLCSDGAFVWYHEGDTASKTPFDCMLKLDNAYCIKQTSLALDRHRCETCLHDDDCLEDALKRLNEKLTSVL